jgi:hypothetical protein
MRIDLEKCGGEAEANWYAMPGKRAMQSDAAGFSG